MAASNYEYPRLRRPEIAAIIAKFQIANVTEQDLSNPSPDLISNLYTRILNHLDFIDAPEHLENPDLDAESVGAINLYTKVKELLDALDCPVKFTFSDLLMPDPHKTEYFLGALLNFCLHREARMESVMEIVGDFNELETQRADLEEKKIPQLKSAISEFNEAREREIPLVQELDAEVKTLRRTVVQLNNKQRSLRVTARKLKDRNVEMEQRISDAEFTLVQSKVERMEVLKKELKKKCRIMREEATEYLRSVKSEVESKRCSLETRQRYVDGVKSEVDAMNGKIASVKEMALVIVEKLENKCEEIVEEFHKYANSISPVLLKARLDTC